MVGTISYNGLARKAVFAALYGINNQLDVNREVMHGVERRLLSAYHKVRSALDYSSQSPMLYLHPYSFRSWERLVRVPDRLQKETRGKLYTFSELGYALGFYSGVDRNSIASMAKFTARHAVETAVYSLTYFMPIYGALKLFLSIIR